MLGVKIDDPIEVQKDFQHLRDWRQTTESIKSKGMLTMTGVLLSGLLAAAWVGIKEFLNK
ncbi:PHA00649 superfamily protein [Xanthomonas phage Mallos]|uniref:PHA00649 superfamily protein n=1 Tax=Xanthomonas phage Mallos TaxID=2939131 RepID=A0A9E7E1Z5_9CAUD|nr:PHA00649 superfamily protein [Xanthomonas phage Mallos]URA07158.1 PHA00649 superfamily protein [Xanthomonas phage Mallos]